MQPEQHETKDLADTLERRTEQRQTSETQVTIHVETREFGGRTKNLSPAGVFFFSPDRLRVTIQIEDEHGRRAARGTLVRVERLNATSTGYAIEFDE